MEWNIAITQKWLSWWNFKFDASNRKIIGNEILGNKHLVGKMTKGHNKHALLARDCKLLEHLVSVACRKKWS